jgi:hypothetical protein
VPVPELPDADLRAAVADMHGRGAGHLFHLAKGARSFAHSLRPVRHGVAAIGEPGTAKTSCLWVERSLAIRAGWEPLTTKSLRSTSTSVLMAAHFERDMPTIFNDLAVNGDSPTSVREDARKLIESLFRPFANREESRGGLIPGANRVLQQRDEWHIQSPPSLSAQTKVLELFQASLLRRVFIGRHRRGDADLAWWEANTDAMADVLRTIGDRVVSMLAEVAEQGAETLGNYLDACDVIGLELLQPVADAMVPGWTETVLNDVVRSVGQHLGGSVMVADVLGIEPSDIIDADTLAWVGRSLAAQWAEINDAHEAADDLSTAVADVVRAGLKTRRVHVRSATGQMEACVPGHTEQEHGLIRKPGGGGFPDEFVGEGCALYYLPTRAAIAVRSAELHTVLAASRDPRIGRATVRTLPGKLLAGNVSIPSTGRYASTHDIEAGAINGRMILLPVALLFDVPGAEPVDQQPAVPEPRPVPDPVAVAEPLPEVGPVDQGAAEPVPTSPAPKRYGASARTQGREAAQRETLAEGIAAIDRGEAPRILAAFEGAYAPRLHGRDLYRRPELPGVAYATYVAAGHSWLREYVGDALVLDRSGAWISSASSVDIAHGGLTHTGPDIDDGRPGLYRVQVHPWHERDTMPHPLGSPNTDTVVVPAPTLKLLQQLADAGRWADATVLDSWTGEPARMWEWASEYVNGLRRHAIETYGRDSAEYNRVKVAFSQAIAMMQGTEKTGGTDRSDRDWKCGTHRPDIATTVQALSAATMWRTLDRARKLCPDLPPIAVRNVDELVIPAGALDILTAGKKPAIVIDPTGIRLGSFKVKAIEMGAEA